MFDSLAKIGIAIVEHQDRFLVGLRGEDSPLPGMAEFPGGKCLADESPEECAVRECREETGLKVRAVRLLGTRTHDYSHGRVELHFWLCEPEESQTAEQDHQGFRWIRREELKALDFPEANSHVVELLSNQGENRSTESDPLA